MTASTRSKPPAIPKNESKLPLSGLLVLFTAGFLGILNETIPAGLLPQMSTSLHLPEAVVGQTMTIYAIATALTAIPLSALLKALSRRTVLIAALTAFILSNAVAAITGDFSVLMIARFVSGVGAGLIWSNIGGYAARIVSAELQGKAVTIAMAGTPLALALGLPAGTLLGDVAGWQATFGVMALGSVGLVIWSIAALPNLSGSTSDASSPFKAILRTRGIRTILWVVAGFMVAHNTIYTYIGPLAIAAGVGDQLEWVLLVFGAAALLSIGVTGAYINPHHRLLMIVSTTLLTGGTLALGFALLSPALLYLGVAVWGFGFGGSATLFVTAGIRAAGTDNVQAVLVTVFNVSIALGGVVGGLLLSGYGVISIPWVAVAVLIPTVLTTVIARRHAFPRLTAHN